MEMFVKLPKEKTASIALTAIVTLAGCHGSTSYVPTAGVAYSAAAAAPSWQSLLTAASVAGSCTKATAKVPGTYILLVAFGNVRNAKFTSVAGSLWLQERYVTARPGPSPTPSTLPSAKPGPPDYLYTGSYTLKKSRQTGCAVLLTTQNGKSFKGSKENAFAVGSPVVKAKAWKIESTGLTGGLTLTVANLSASGGRGSAKLTTSTGAPYDTATIALTARLSSP